MGVGPQLRSNQLAETGPLAACLWSSCCREREERQPAATGGQTLHASWPPCTALRVSQSLGQPRTAVSNDRLTGSHRAPACLVRGEQELPETEWGEGAADRPLGFGADVEQQHLRRRHSHVRGGRGRSLGCTCRGGQASPPCHERRRILLLLAHQLRHGTHSLSTQHAEPQHWPSGATQNLGSMLRYWAFWGMLS